MEWWRCCLSNPVDDDDMCSWKQNREIYFSFRWVENNNRKSGSLCVYICLSIRICSAFTYFLFTETCSFTWEIENISISHCTSSSIFFIFKISDVVICRQRGAQKDSRSWIHKLIQRFSEIILVNSYPLRDWYVISYIDTMIKTSDIWYDWYEGSINRVQLLCFNFVSLI